MNKLALWTSVTLMAFSTAAYAGPDDVRPVEPKTKTHQGYGKHDDKYKHLSPEEREAHFKERKAKWDAMSDAEKVKAIEEKRSERLKQMDDEWKHLSDREKIEHIEKRFQHKGKEGCGKKGLFGKGPHEGKGPRGPKPE